MKDWIVPLKPRSMAGCAVFARLLMLMALVVCVVPAAALALEIPERLVFDLTWTGGVKAGTAVQEIVDGGDSIKVTSIAKSADWISVFFPVEDSIESTLSKAQASSLGVPRQYRMKVREGKHRRDKEIIFDHNKGKAYYTDNLNGEKAVVDILPNTYDTYSCFYHIRTLKLEVGKSVFVNILDNKQLWNVEVQVLKKEKIKTIFGKVNTIVIRPLIKSEGIFEKNGAIDIWLTDDDRRIPVKMKTKVAIGSVTATLVEIKPER